MEQSSANTCFPQHRAICSHWNLESQPAYLLSKKDDTTFLLFPNSPNFNRLQNSWSLNCPDTPVHFHKEYKKSIQPTPCSLSWRHLNALCPQVLFWVSQRVDDCPTLSDKRKRNTDVWSRQSSLPIQYTWNRKEVECPWHDSISSITWSLSYSAFSSFCIYRYL